MKKVIQIDKTTEEKAEALLKIFKVLENFSLKDALDVVGDIEEGIKTFSVLKFLWEK